MDYSLWLLISYILLCRYNVVFHLHYILGRRGDVKMCSVLKYNNNVFIGLRLDSAINILERLYFPSYFK